MAYEPTKPFISYTIERYNDCAEVRVLRCWFESDTGPLHTETLESYETASRGATASARKAVAIAKAKVESA